jgi:protein gp37
MKTTKIEWTDTTWNPVTGCTKLSEGCQHCYAERMARRLHAMGLDRYRNGFEVTIHPELFDEPLSWKQPRRVFVNSMSDLFHRSVPLATIKKLFDVMNEATQHTFQILTKRADRLADLAPKLTWGPNIWMGVTVESERQVDRIQSLTMVEAAVRFVSFEPLLSGIPDSTSLSGINWAIIGGESGPGARLMNKEWVLGLKAMCERDDVAFFFKQWGGVNKHRNGRLLEGRVWDGMPVTNRA